MQQHHPLETRHISSLVNSRTKTHVTEEIAFVQFSFCLSKLSHSRTAQCLQRLQSCHFATLCHNYAKRATQSEAEQSYSALMPLSRRTHEFTRADRATTRHDGC